VALQAAYRERARSSRSPRTSGRWTRASPTTPSRSWHSSAPPRSCSSARTTS
jgi:hypothetical protein